MSRKLEGNGLWESSRMMLPEHREQWLGKRREEGKKVRPVITEEEQEQFARCLMTSKMHKIDITITLYGEYEDRQIVAVVDRIDPQYRTVRLIHEEGYEWIAFANITAASLL